jgi:hypothetical protein
MADVVDHRQIQAWDYAVMRELRTWLGRSTSWISCEQTDGDQDAIRNALRKAGQGRPVLFEPLQVTRLLDTIFGIDGFLLMNRRFVPVAKRIQFLTSTGGWRYETITIRAQRDSGYPTELHKLMSNSTVKPELFVQAYIDDRKAKPFAWEADRVIIASAQLILRCESWTSRINSNDGTGFRAYDVRSLTETARQHDLPVPVVLGCGYA